jgi:hypothetical protein
MDEITYIWKCQKISNNNDANNEVNIDKIIHEITHLINYLQLYPKIIKEKNDSVYGDDVYSDNDNDDDGDSVNILFYEIDGVINKHHIYFNNIYDANKTISTKNNKYETFLFIFNLELNGNISLNFNTSYYIFVTLILLVIANNIGGFKFTATYNSNNKLLVQNKLTNIIAIYEQNVRTLNLNFDPFSQFQQESLDTSLKYTNCINDNSNFIVDWIYSLFM